MDVNVFELAFKENAALAEQPAKPSRKVVESVARRVTELTEKKALKKEAVQLGKIRFTEDTEEISSVQPDDDIVVVYSDDIKPDMSEEEVEQAAQALIGATICKCGVCGANYIATEDHNHDDEIVVEPEGEAEETADEFTFTDDEGESLDDIDFADEELGESLLFREDVEETDTDAETSETEEVTIHKCPVCDAAENQVEVGEIVPTEEAETTEEPISDDDDEISAEDASEDGESLEDTGEFEPSEGPATEEGTTNEPPVKVDVDINVNDEDAELSKEALDVVKKPRITRRTRNESKKPTRVSKKPNTAVNSITFNEMAFNRLLNRFVAENYENVSNVKITSGKATKNGELCFEGIVTATSGKKRAITFETIGFKYTEGLMKIKMIEKGPFTEAARVQKNAVPFVLECKARAGRVLPTAFKCRYAVKMANEWFECRGRYTLSESTKKNK